MKGLCCVKLCNTELYSTVVILPFFRKKLSFVILKGRKGELNTKRAPLLSFKIHVMTERSSSDVPPLMTD